MMNYEAPPPAPLDPPYGCPSDECGYDLDQNWHGNWSCADCGRPRPAPNF